jgi:hypothetical protein
MHPRLVRWWGYRLFTTTVGTAVLVVGALTACSGSVHPTIAADGDTTPTAVCGSNELASYVRTELFFGKSIPGGGIVADSLFAQFLDQEVTPRFPGGFTVVHAMGQYREANGVIDHETSDILILLYPRGSLSEANKKIEEIRAAYSKAFHQESVLREEEQPSCVSF